MVTWKKYAWRYNQFIKRDLTVEDKMNFKSFMRITSVQFEKNIL